MNEETTAYELPSGFTIQLHTINSKPFWPLLLDALVESTVVDSSIELDMLSVKDKLAIGKYVLRMLVLQEGLIYAP